MAHRGQVIENPLSGERITFRETAADTGGELLAIDLELAPGGRVPAGLHVHPEQEERFEVVRGHMRFRVRRERVVAGPGQVLVVPAGVPHDFANAGTGPALVRVEVRPALAMERLFETAVALARDGRAFANGMPKPLDLALFVREFEREVQAAFPPLWMQRIALAPLAWAAERRDRGRAGERGNRGRARERGDRGRSGERRDRVAQRPGRGRSAEVVGLGVERADPFGEERLGDPLHAG